MNLLNVYVHANLAATLALSPMTSPSLANLPGPRPVPLLGDTGNRLRLYANPLRELVRLGRYGPVNNNVAYGRTKLLDQLFEDWLFTAGKPAGY